MSFYWPILKWHAAFLSIWIGAIQAAPAVGKETPAATDVEFTAKLDGTKQQYTLILPPAFQKGDSSHDLLIVLHGHGSDRHQIMDDSVHEFQAAREVAAARKMIVVAPDYRGRTSWMGPKAENDVVQIIDEMKANYKIGKVVISGASMGGSSALTFTALHPKLVDGVVSMNGTANHVEYKGFQDFISKSFGGTKTEIPDEYKNRSAEFWPERFTMPTAITASGQDKTVPPASVLRLADAIKKIHPDNVLLIYREDAGHATSFDDSKAAFEFVLAKVQGHR